MEQEPKIIFRPMSEDAVTPTQSTIMSAGYDLFTSRDQIVTPGELALLHTDLTMQYPDGLLALIALRSSTPKKWGLLMPHGMGIIDQDYCGPQDELLIQVFNFTERKPSLSVTMIPRHTKIAQLIFVNSETPRFTWNDSIPSAEEYKNRGGFGSTG